MYKVSTTQVFAAFLLLLQFVSAEEERFLQYNYAYGTYGYSSYAYSGNAYSSAYGYKDTYTSDASSAGAYAMVWLIRFIIGATLMCCLCCFCWPCLCISGCLTCAESIPCVGPIFAVVDCCFCCVCNCCCILAVILMLPY